jgi:hypothetical protein
MSLSEASRRDIDLLLGVYAALRRGRIAKQSLSTQIFVEIGPVEAIAAASDLPIIALRGRGVQQARIPAAPR